MDYDAEDISRGDYLQVMNEQMERFFAIEPYRTYRDYFDVYTAIAVSPENGIGGDQHYSRYKIWRQLTRMMSAY